jgi:ABC-type multidrug transport system ATPase subunit
MRAIEVTDLTKSFNGVIGVDKISFGVENGELFGLLGHNGSNFFEKSESI